SWRRISRLPGRMPTAISSNNWRNCSCPTGCNRCRWNGSPNIRATCAPFNCASTRLAARSAVIARKPWSLLRCGNNCSAAPATNPCTSGPQHYCNTATCWRNTASACSPSNSAPACPSPKNACASNGSSANQNLICRSAGPGAIAAERPLLQEGGGLQAFYDDAADGVTGTERTDHATRAFFQVSTVLVEGNDRTGRTGVGIFIQDHRRLDAVRRATQHALRNQLVHA